MKHVFDVANYFLEKARQEDRGLTPMQLIKLCYLAHGFMLGAYDRGLFDQKIQAWQYGPVVQELYQKVRGFRDRPITINMPGPGREFDSEETEVMDNVYEVFGRFNGNQLSTYTHKKDSPWDIAWNISGRNTIIPDSLMKIYFDGLIVKDAD